MTNDLYVSPGATLLTETEQVALWDLTKADENSDQGAIVVDCEAYNVGVNVQHRVTANESVGGRMAFHGKVTEIYYVTNGEGTFVTAGGAMSDIKPNAYSTDEVRASNGRGMVGPGGSAVFAGPMQESKLARGDIIIIPPNTGHYLSAVNAFRYLVFRVDPEHVLPSGFVNDYIKK